MSRLTDVRDALQMASSAKTQEQRAALALNLYKLLKEAESAKLSLLEKAQLAGLRKKAEAFIACVKQEYDEKVTLITELLKQPTYEDSPEGELNRDMFKRNYNLFKKYMEALHRSLGDDFWRIRLRCDPLSEDDWPIQSLAEIVNYDEANHSWYDRKHVSRPFGAKLWDFYVSVNGKERWARRLLNCCGWSEEVFG